MSVSTTRTESLLVLHNHQSHRFWIQIVNTVSVFVYFAFNSNMINYSATIFPIKKHNMQYIINSISVLCLSLIHISLYCLMRKLMFAEIHTRQLDSESNKYHPALQWQSPLHVGHECYTLDYRDKKKTHFLIVSLIFRNANLFQNTLKKENKSLDLQRCLLYTSRCV